MKKDKIINIELSPVKEKKPQYAWVPDTMYMYVVLYERYGRDVFLTCHLRTPAVTIDSKNLIKPHVHLRDLV